jgi:hypothetical protein
MVVTSKEYYLVIRTTAYAGNFERELCAHLTGAVRDCGVGSQFVDNEVERLFQRYIEPRYDQGYQSLFTPVGIGYDHQDVGLNNQDVVIYLRDDLPQALKSLIKERLETFNDKRRDISEFRIQEVPEFTDVFVMEVDVTKKPTINKF